MGLFVDSGDVIVQAYGFTIDYVLRLFENNVTPAKATVIADLTECTDVDYSPITLLSASWSHSAVSDGAGGTMAQSEYPLQTFGLSSLANTQYGWHLTYGGVLVAAGAFSSVFEAGGGDCKIVPVLNGDGA